MCVFKVLSFRFYLCHILHAFSTIPLIIITVKLHLLQQSVYIVKFQGYQGSGPPPSGPMPPPSSSGNYYQGGPPVSKPSGPPNAALPPNGPPMPSRGPAYPGHYGGPPRPIFPPGKTGQTRVEASRQILYLVQSRPGRWRLMGGGLC